MLLGEDYKKFESIAKDIGDYENTLVVLRSPGGEFGAADILRPTLNIRSLRPRR
jgi:hypothetical protein